MRKCDYNKVVLQHNQNMFKKVNKTISLLRKLQNSLPRAIISNNLKPFIRPHLNYRGILYDQMFNNSFS